MPVRESTVISASSPPPAQPVRRPSRFGEVLRTVASAAASAVPVIGPILGAAVSAVMGRQGPLDIGEGRSEALQLIELQRAISRETQTYEAVSNVMKARHDAAMNSIRNFRS